MVPELGCVVWGVPVFWEGLLRVSQIPHTLSPYPYPLTPFPGPSPFPTPGVSWIGFGGGLPGCAGGVAGVAAVGFGMGQARFASLTDCQPDCQPVVYNWGKRWGWGVVSHSRG